MGLLGSFGVVAVSSPGAPSAPALPSPFPGDARFLPGVTVAMLRGQMADGATCRELGSSGYRVPHRLRCQSPISPSSNMSLEVYYQDETHVRAVAASCRAYRSSHASSCTDFRGRVAGAVFDAGEEPLSPKEREWVRADHDSKETMTIGVVDMRSDLFGRMTFAAAG